MADVEEGEISDTASVEEISEEDFKKQDDDDDDDEVKVVKETPAPAPAAAGNTTRVWTMTDLYKYQMTGRGYVTGLYNLAWAQAVQNKSLDEVIVEVIEPPGAGAGEERKRASPPVSSSSSGERKVEKVVIDDDSGGEVEEEEAKVVDAEKEEGELEEGEIDFDSGPGDGEEEMNVDGGDDEKSKVELVKEALESVSVGEVEKSFDAGCRKLQSALEGLRDVAKQDDGVVRLLVSAVRAVSLVFGSMDCKLKEQNKDIFSRLISAVKTNHSADFSPEQIKELDVMIASAYVNDVQSSSLVKKGEVLKDTYEMMDTDKDSVAKGAVHYAFSNNSSVSPVPSEPDKPSSLLEASKSNFRSRAGVLRPLLDLHKVHDLDSLPSPTREMTPSFPVVHKMPNMVDEISRPGPLLPKVDAVLRMHPYETDAVKAVSSYQQRFGRSSFFPSDSLPSPTPSEDSADGTGGDTGGEITSSRNSGPPALSKAVASVPIPFSERSVAATIIPTKAAVPLSSGSAPTVKPSAKSRDPRLRFLNPDPGTPGQDRSSLSAVSSSHKVEPAGGMMSLKKNKLLDDPIADGPKFKRQRNMPEVSANNRKTANGSGGWLDDNEMIGPQSKNGNNLVRSAASDPRRTDNMATSTVSSIMAPVVNVGVNEQMPVSLASSMPGNGQAPVAGTPLTSLPELLKNIAVNPTMLMNILKLGQQQKLATESQNLADQAKSTPPSLSSNSALGAMPATTGSPAQPGIELRPPGTPQPSPPASVDEAGKIRMKPRDPRRALHTNTLQRTGSMSGDPLRINVPPISTLQLNKDSQFIQKQEGQADKKSITSQPSVLPDISLPFTHSLKNIADIVSVSQGSATQPLDSPVPSSQPIPVRADRCDANVVSLNPDQKPGAASAREVAVAASRPQSSWGDVEHLFEGYDDQQKAAIQRERARRIEEQRKMFAARKLCLVLDLDHTLLNSAKFAEVDPVHDEILRKKEEQDREKPYRHIFRFQHMAMWTKLRPGIWNFLEKASKLFELHLYTMGNKLYATEMAKVLDPKGVLFAGRVISRGDDGEPFDGDERVPKSKDLEGVLGMESAVVIVDDSVRVWPHNKLNLIVVERYIYFPCSRRQFGLPGPSLLEIDHDERPEDGTLACSLAVIERIHQNFYNHQSLEEADVRNILASEQRKILAGCRIVFSRVFPVGEANPHLHPLWQTAEQFGAICSNQMDDQVTHVVANSLGTDKVNWALSSGKFVVHPGWVEASALLYRRANEQDFAIKP